MLILLAFSKNLDGFLKFDVSILGFEVTESVNFTRVLRYRVRYLIFDGNLRKVLILLNLMGFELILTMLNFLS